MVSDDELRRRGIEQARKEQREASQRGRDSNERGRWFHRGMAELRGETREHGWRHEQPLELGPGLKRVHDTARSVNELGGRDFTEYKWGENVGGELTMSQLVKDREALRRDNNARGTWVLVQGAADPATRRELDALARDFPGRFHVEEITQQQAVRALRLGRELERNRNQLELVDSSKLRSQQRARDLYERAQEKEYTRESARRAVEQQDRERREQAAIELARQKQREAVERLKESSRRNQEAIARGQTPPMTAQEAADILAVSRPTPGVKAPFREPPRPNRSSRNGPTKERGLERDR